MTGGSGGSGGGQETGAFIEGGGGGVWGQNLCSGDQMSAQGPG